MATTKIQPAGIANGGVTQTDTQALTNKDLSSGTNNLGLKTIANQSIQGSGDNKVVSAPIALTMNLFYGIF